MSLLQNLPFTDFQRASKLTVQQCENIANNARLKNIKFNESNNPGDLLLKNLDRKGFTVQEYRNLISTLNSERLEYYKPNIKFAILIGNYNYVHLPKLATPPADCNILSSHLTNLGFTVIILKNTTGKSLRDIFKKIFETMPQDSYCFIFYAGHGCELNGTTFILGVDCPTENIQIDHCVTQNYLIEVAGRCKPDLTVIVLDMCRFNLESHSNPSLYTYTQNRPIIAVDHKNLIICYTTQSSECAYEVIELLDYSKNIDSDMTYELRTCDLANVVLKGSQYVNALCKHLMRDHDVDSLLNLVHEDLKEAKKKQKPLKLKFGEGKRSLHDPAIGNTKDLLSRLEDIGQQFKNVI